MSSKASGEPCLMLSAGVLTALQNATAAARAEFAGAGADDKVEAQQLPTTHVWFKKAWT